MPEVDDAAKDLYRKALITELTGLLVVTISQHANNKMKLRSSITSNLKYMKTELNPTLNDQEQHLVAQSLLHPVLQTRVSQGLKLK